MRGLVVALALCAVMVGAAPLTAGTPRPRVPVFVKVDGSAPDGWMDVNSGRQDSVKDLARLLSSDARKWISLAANEASARVVLSVVERHMEEDGELHVVTVRMMVGDVETTVYGRAGTGWGDASRKLVLQLDTWANEHRDQILAARATSTH